MTTSTPEIHPPAATFTPCSNHGFAVVGFDIHVGADRPVLADGYALHDGAPSGSGPAPMSFDVDDDIATALLDRFGSRAGVAASSALDDETFKYALMLWPGLGEFADHLLRQFPKDTCDSAMTFGPVWHLWFDAVALHTSSAGTDQWLSHSSRFNDLAATAVAVHGWELAWHPGTPYRKGIQEYWIRSRLPKLDVPLFRGQLRHTNGSLARGFGQFPTGIAPDPTRVDPRSIAEADGTTVKPQTKVREVVTTDDEGAITRIRAHSKALDPLKARVDPRFGAGNLDSFVDDKDKDIDPKKRKIGRNHIFTLTQVFDQPHTRVVLDVVQVPAGTGEEPIGRDAIIDLGNTLNGALHLFAYDMAQQPQSRDLIFDATGVVVVNRNRSITSADAVEIHALGGPAFGVRQPRHRLTHSATNSFLAERAGLSRHHGEARASTHALLGHVVHRATDGTECIHLLAGDDGNLVELFDDDLGSEIPVPSPLAPLTGTVHVWTKTSAPAPDDANHVSLTRYQLRCAATGERINLWLEHRPTGIEPRSDLRRIENYVRPLPEPSASFAVMHGVRQNPESLNSVFQGYLDNKNHGRASRADDLPMWWVAVGFIIGENASVWFRHTDLHHQLSGGKPRPVCTTTDTPNDPQP